MFIGKIDGRQTCVTLGLAAIFAAVLLPGMHGVAAMVVTMVAIFILGQLLKRTLGGQTGDTLGAAIELGELHWLVCTVAKRDYSQRTWRNFVQICYFYQQII